MRCAAALLVLLLLCPGRAGAQVASLGDYDVSLTETFYADWHRNFIYGSGKSSTTYDYFDVKNRLNVHARSRALQAGMRMDMAGFIGPSSGPSGENFQGQFDNDIGVEKFYARYRHKAMGVEVGDVYGCLGKGIALCVKKMDELATDTTVRGLKVYYNGRTFGAMAMGGLTNLVNVGDLIEQKLPDPNDLVSGAELRFSPVYWARATVHGGLLVDRNELPDEAKNALGFVELWDDNSGAAARREMLLTVGPTLSFPDLFDVGSLMLEYDAMVQTWTGGDEADHPDPLAAHALYTTATLNVGLAHLMVEGKWYESFLEGSQSNDNFMGTRVQGESGVKDFAYYSILPPVDDEALFTRHDRPYDVVGGRFRTDVEVPPLSGVVFASYTHFGDTDMGPARSDDYYLHHVMGGWEQRLDSLSIVANASGGWREEHHSFTDFEMYHFEGDVHFPIFGPHSMEIAGRREAYNQDPGPEYSIAKVGTTYSLAPWLGLSYNYEYSEEPGSRQGARGHFHSGEVIYRFMSGSYAKVFVGSSRGGLKCAGGMCRVFPTFEGVKGEVTLRF